MIILKEIQKGLHRQVEGHGLDGRRLDGYQHAVDDLAIYPHPRRLRERLTELRRERRMRRRHYLVLAAHEGVPRKVEESLLFLEGTISGYAQVLRAMTDFLEEDADLEEFPRTALDLDPDGEGLL